MARRNTFGLLSRADIDAMSPEIRRRIYAEDESRYSLSKNKIRELLNSEGGSVVEEFTPHEIAVKADEEIAAKILSFLLNSHHQEICVLSARGTVSCVAIREPGCLIDDLKSYKGYFQILSLTGSYHMSGQNYARSKTGGLSVKLRGLDEDGQVICGNVAGVLTAADPVTVIVGTFKSNDSSNATLRMNQLRPSSSNDGAVDDGAVDSETSDNGGN